MSQTKEDNKYLLGGCLSYLLFLSFGLFVIGCLMQKVYLDMWYARTTFQAEFFKVERLEAQPVGYDSEVMAHGVVGTKKVSYGYNPEVRYIIGDSIPIWHSPICQPRILVRNIEETIFNFENYIPSIIRVFLKMNLPFLILLLIFIIVIKI